MCFVYVYVNIIEEATRGAADEVDLQAEEEVVAYVCV